MEKEGTTHPFGLGRHQQQIQATRARLAARVRRLVLALVAATVLGGGGLAVLAAQPASADWEICPAQGLAWISGLPGGPCYTPPPTYTPPVEATVNNSGAWIRYGVDGWDDQFQPGASRVAVTNFTWNHHSEARAAFISSGGAFFRTTPGATWQLLNYAYSSPTDIAMSGMRIGLINNGGVWFRVNDASPWQQLDGPSDNPTRIVMGGDRIALINKWGAWERENDSDRFHLVRPPGDQPMDIALGGDTRTAVVVNATGTPRADIRTTLHGEWAPLTSEPTYHVAMGGNRTAVITASGAFDRWSDTDYWHYLASAADNPTAIALG